MGIPTVKLSHDTTLRDYATSTNSILEIQSMLFKHEPLQFLAFLTDMGQSFSSTWNTEDIFGRNDPVAIFQGTKRTISLSFNVVAGNLAEAKNNLVKLDVLSSFMYPSYKQINSGGVIVASHMQGAPLVKVKFANLVNSNLSGQSDGLLGYVDSLNITPVLDSGTFHSEGKHFPKAYEIGFSLNVLHQETPGWDQNGNWIGQKHFFGSRTGASQITQETADAYPTSEQESTDPSAETVDPYATSEQD